MTRKIASTCFAAMFGLAIVNVSAQTPPQQPQTPTSAPQASAMDHAGKMNKLTGCVQAGTDANSYQLSNIKKGHKMEGATASNESTPAMAPSDKAGKNVTLKTSSGVDLAAHVGHTVEVSGNWAAASADASSTAGSMAGAKEFTVTSVKMVSATCSAGTN